MVKKRNKNSENGFVPIRRGIYEHLKEGRITGQELMVYLLLHLKADHRTGICYKISGPAIAGLLRISQRQANRLLARLEKKGYIKRLDHRGQVPYYPVVINKFLTSNGLLIDAPNTKSLNEIACRKGEGRPLRVFQLSCIQEYIQEDNNKFPQNSDEFRLSELLFKEIKNRKSDFKRPNLQRWCEYIDLMIRIDHRTPERIAEVIRWCQADKFWQNNILSTAKLRNQFDQLELKMGKQSPTPLEPLKVDSDGKTPRQRMKEEIERTRNGQ